MASAPASNKQGSATRHHPGTANTLSDTATANCSLVGNLLHYATTQPNHEAICSPKLRLSYARFAQLLTNQVAELEKLGITSSAVVGIMCADEVSHLLLCLAASYLGASSCTIPSYEAEETRKLLIEQCGVTHLVDNNSAMALEIDKLDSSRGQTLTPPDGNARLLFSTSGTTGKPKLVIHNDADIVAQAHRHIASREERFACLASMEHNFAKRHRLYCLAAGATNVFLDPQQASLVSQCQALAVNVLHVSAFQAQELLATPGVNALSNIRLKLGGSHVPAALREKLRHHITPTLQAGYGTTETGAIAFTNPDDREAGESVGQPLPGIEVRTVSPDRQTLATGERGELAIRCQGMFRGYLGNPEHTNARLQNDWFYTGDLGYLDPQQRIHLCGRADDMFVFNSMNIYPQDIESRIRQYPDVTDTAVLPKSSAVHGHIPVALVVFHPDAKPKLPALKKFVTEQVGLRCPRQFILVDEIPRNASGKIVRQQALGLSAQSDEIRQAIIQALVQALNAQPSDFLKPDLIEAFVQGEKDITLRELALDSIARMELLIKLELEYNAVITPQEFAQFRSLGNIVARVLALQSKPDKTDLLPQQNSAPIAQPQSAPYIIRFFQRVFHFCPTVAQLHKALSTLEFRLTPEQLEQLYHWHTQQQLIPNHTAEKFHSALNQWFDRINSMMPGSGKPSPEPFSARKIAPAITLFTGPGLAKDKRLLICFAVAGGRSLMMPNAVLLQHTDASQYDLLLIAEPFNEGYRRGLPFFGNDVMGMLDRLAKLELIRNYCALRTLGCSAGGYPAVIAGFRLGAELAISIGGRFHSERHPRKILGRLLTTWRGTVGKRCNRVLMTYATGINRDRHYARIIAWLTGGSLLAIEFNDERARHHILQQLAERGELTCYLSRTLFADKDSELLSPRTSNRITLPES